MGGITLSMTAVESVREQVSMEWFDAFNKCFGISPEKTSNLQLLEDIRTKTLEGQESETSSLYCRGVNPPRKHKHILGLLARFRKSKSEFLVSQEDADEVISCCLWVLDVTYGIHFNASHSVKLCYKHGSGLPVMIKNMPHIEAGSKVQKKRPGKQKNEWTISILYNASYISAVIIFLEECFSTGIRDLEEKCKASEKKHLEDLETLKNSENPEVPEPSKSPEDSENPTDRETEEEQRKKQEEYEKEKEERRNKKRTHIIVWLVANCLYTMGELAYAEQYIADYQKDRGKEDFAEVCKMWGIPWTMQGKMLEMNDVIWNEN